MMAPRAQRWTEALIEERVEEIGDAFRAGGSQAPFIVWSPGEADMVTQIGRFTLGHWLALKGDRRAPLVEQIDAVELRQALGHLILIDPIDGGADFRYRLYGSRVAAISGFDMTGKRISEHPASDYVVDLSLASSRACVTRVEPLLTVRRPVGSAYTAHWERLALPFLDEDGSVGRVLVSSVPLAKKDAELYAAFHSRM